MYDVSGMNSLSSEAKGIWDYDEKTMNSGGSVTADDQEEETTEDFNTGTEDEADEEEQEEDGTEIDLEVHAIKPKSPRKDRPRKSKSLKAQSMESSVEVKEDRRRILYVYRNGKVTKLSAYSHDTISTVKVRIQRKTGIAPQRQFLEWDGLSLEDKRTISHYGIPTDATLVLMKVKKKDRELQKSDLMLKRVESQNGDQSESEEERDEPDDRHKRRNDSSRRTGSPTHRRLRPQDSQEAPLSPLSPKQKKPPRQQNHAYSPLREDDSYLSATISANHDDDPRRRQQALLNKMKIQSRDNHDHEDPSIDPGSTLPSRPRPKPSHDVNVFINTIMGFTITLTAKSSDTIHHLKHLIEEQEDIPFRKQILILEGVPLVDSQQLSDYTSSTSLHVLLRLQAGSNSVASVAASSLMTPTSNMASLTRKMNQNKIMSRTTVASAANTGVGSSKWR